MQSAIEFVAREFKRPPESLWDCDEGPGAMYLYADRASAEDPDGYPLALVEAIDQNHEPLALPARGSHYEGL